MSAGKFPGTDFRQEKQQVKPYARKLVGLNMPKY